MKLKTYKAVLTVTCVVEAKVFACSPEGAAEIIHDMDLNLSDADICTVQIEDIRRVEDDDPND